MGGLEMSGKRVVACLLCALGLVSVYAKPVYVEKQDMAACLFGDRLAKGVVCDWEMVGDSEGAITLSCDHVRYTQGQTMRISSHQQYMTLENAQKLWDASPSSTGDVASLPVEEPKVEEVPDASDPAQTRRIAALLDDGLYQHFSEISQLSFGLSPSDRQLLYGYYSKDTRKAFWWNLLGGFGIGCFLEEDVMGGTIAFVTDLAGTILWFKGFVDYLHEMDKADDDLYYDPKYEVSLLTQLAGIAVMVLSSAYSISRGFSYGRTYNARLQQALSGRKSPSVAMVPLVVPSKEALQVGLVAQASL